MRITIAAIGKLTANSPEHSLLTQFKKRLPWKLDIKEFQVKKQLPTPQLKEMESELLLGAVPDGAKMIALDERGKTLTSPEFASTLQQWQDDGFNQFAFLIGGAAGHGSSIYQKSHLQISFGKMTWPHMMVRAMLCEQLYRAHTINTGHPYHKE